MKSNSIKRRTFSCQRENLTIRGTEYRPQGNHLPIAIVCHGFMAFQGTVKHYAQLLAELGYVAYCFDFCGGCVIKGKSDGKTTDMSVLSEILDLQAVMLYARERPYTDENHVILMGCSQGGLVCALLASQYPQDIQKLIMFYPAFCIPDDARRGQMMFAKFDPYDIPEMIRCGPMKLGRCYVTDVIDMDPYQKVIGYKNDVLIVHGTEDHIVDLSYSEKLYGTYLENQNRDVIFEKIQGGKHGFSKKYDRVAMEVLRRYLMNK